MNAAAPQTPPDPPKNGNGAAPNDEAGERARAQNPIFAKMAEKFGVSPGKLWHTLKATAFKQKDSAAPVSDEQMVALLIVADQYGLNPFTKELYAYPDKQNGIVPVVSVDGWTRIINGHPQFASLEFIYSAERVQLPGAKWGHEWIECVISRRDRDKATPIREYLDEVYREPLPSKFNKGEFLTGPWQSHTKRMHRHKALIQAARVTFGFAGIYDADEAERILEGQDARESARDAITVQATPVANGNGAHTDKSKSRAKQLAEKTTMNARESLGLDQREPEKVTAQTPPAPSSDRAIPPPSVRDINLHDEPADDGH